MRCGPCADRVLPENPLARSAWSSRSRSRRLKRLSARERWSELLDGWRTEVVNAGRRERGVHLGRRSVEGSRPVGAWWSIAVASGGSPLVPVVKPTDLGKLDQQRSDPWERPSRLARASTSGTASARSLRDLRASAT
jgi:hypothetical protein